MEISVKEFMQMQPGYPAVGDTDKYYYVIAVHVARAWDKSGVLTDIDERARVRVVLMVMGYYQDIVADAGLWRTFTMLHGQRYGSPLPHYGRSDDYIDYELNVDDLRYIIWHTLDFSPEVTTPPSPHDAAVLRLAEVFHEVLDYDYEHAPSSFELMTLTGVDVDDENDRQTTYDLACWFYWRSYLMQGNALAAAAEAMPQARDIIARHGEADATPLLHDLNDRIMATRPATIGPITLPLAQWLKYITGRE